MLAIVNTPGGPEPVAIRDVPDPQPKPNEAVVAVHAFSLNRGELRLLQVRPEGWRPVQDIAGIVVTDTVPAGLIGDFVHAATPNARRTDRLSRRNVIVRPPKFIGNRRVENGEPVWNITRKCPSSLATNQIFPN